jgi:hypothetical protein
MVNHLKSRAVEPLLGEILDSEWDKLLKPLLMKRIGLYLREIEDQQSDGMCNENNPERRCICREEFGRKVCGNDSELNAIEYSLILKAAGDVMEAYRKLNPSTIFDHRVFNRLGKFISDHQIKEASRG